MYILNETNCTIIDVVACLKSSLCFFFFFSSCNTCVERELVRKREFPCPRCGSTVKKMSLTQRTLDAVQAEKDTNWRRRVRAVHNKTEDDFGNLREYNDYLEMIENIIYTIVYEEKEAEDCKAAIKEHEQKNKQEINIRRSQRADTERAIQDKIGSEQREMQKRRLELAEERKFEQSTKRMIKLQKTQVLLGEREEVSIMAAQMQGYKNELRKSKTVQFVSPRVREPPGGLRAPEGLDREVYRKRQSAGGAIPVGSISSQERNWNETLSSLFPDQMEQ